MKQKKLNEAPKLTPFKQAAKDGDLAKKIEQYKKAVKSKNVDDRYIARQTLLSTGRKFKFQRKDWNILTRLTGAGKDAFSAKAVNYRESISEAKLNTYTVQLGRDVIEVKAETHGQARSIAGDILNVPRMEDKYMIVKLKESKNEGTSADAQQIHIMTRLGKDKIQNFIDDNGLSADKIVAYLKGGGSERKWDLEDLMNNKSKPIVKKRLMKQLKESNLREAKYDIGMARKGNGITVYNKADEESGDYKNVAHIDNNGKVKYFDKSIPADVKKKIEAEADKIVGESKKSTKLTDVLKESVAMGRVYSNPYARSFMKEEEEEDLRDSDMALTDEQKQAFMEAVKQYKKYGEAVYRNAGLGEVYEAIKSMVEMAGKVTLSETDDWFDNVTVSRHMKRMGESFKVFEKTLKEVSTLQQRLESSYDEIGEVLNKYYEISEELDPVGKEDGDIDNDGDEDASDEYLANRRKVVTKAVQNESKGRNMKLIDLLNEGKRRNLKEAKSLSGKEVAARMKKDRLMAIPLKNYIAKYEKMDTVSLDDLHRDLPDWVDGGRIRKVFESVNEAEDIAGWIAFYNGKKLEIEKGKDADSLYDAKKFAIAKLKVPKSKQSLVSIKPAYND